MIVTQNYTGIISMADNSAILVTRNAESTKLIPSIPNTTKEWAINGDDDQFPNDLYKELKTVGVLTRSLIGKRNLHYGKGMLHYTLSADKEGHIQKDILLNPVITAYHRANRSAQKQIELIRQLENYALAYVEIILNEPRTKIISHKVIDYRYARIDKINNQTGRPMFVYVSADFSETYASSNGKIVRVPMLDMDNPLEHLKNDTSHKYIAVYKYEDGELYYPKPIWNTLRESKWLSIIKSIPEIKQAIFDNQMTLKYHIEVSDLFLKQRFPKWPEMDEKTRKTKFDELLNEINKNLTATKNQGKSILSIFEANVAIGKEMQGLRINVLDHKFNDGMYNLDTADGNSQIMFTVGMHPEIFGHGIPGGKEMSGSGAGIREALLAHRAQIEPDRVVSTELWRLIADYNGWGNQVDTGYADLDTSQTLDKNPTGSKNVM